MIILLCQLTPQTPCCRKKQITLRITLCPLRLCVGIIICASVCARGVLSVPLRGRKSVKKGLKNAVLHPAQHFYIVFETYLYTCLARMYYLCRQNCNVVCESKSYY